MGLWGVEQGERYVRKLMISACALMLIALGYTATAFAKELRVGTCGKSGYPTIQAAVNAASPGDSIKVCAGTYVEQVTVPAGKDKLTLQSEKPLQAIIKAPAAMADPKAIVRVNGAQDVKIREFTIAGPGGSGCDSLRYGVRVDNGGSATIEKNDIVDIRDQPFGGCQNGVGILVGRNAETTTGSATIKDNTIERYQKNGMTIDNTGSSATIEHNTITGWGPTATIAQNGIQISRGATASAKNNDVSGNVYTPQTDASTGVLLFQPGDTNVEHNDFDSNDVGVYAILVGGGVSVKGNTATASTYDGIALDAATGSTVTDNDSNGNDVGIGLYSISGPTTGVLLKGNKAANNATYGFYADSGTSNNTFRDGKASGSGVFDCRDESVGAGTAGTANFWLNVKGATSSPPSLCKP